jgi:hypothetical protein
VTVPPVTAIQIARARQYSLLLSERGARSCAEIAEWFGALQSQDLASGKWSLGVRMADATEADVDRALEGAEVLRTWPMRGTIHITAPQDARWLLELTGSRALASSRTRRRQLGLDPATEEKAADLLMEGLRGGRRLTRADALRLLDDAGIATSGQRGYHLLGYAAQSGRTCFGPQAGKQQTFVRLDEWAPQQRQLDRDGSLCELAHRFVRSHGPVPVRDFAGWSGLTLTDARAGVAANAGRVVPLACQGDQLWASTEVGDLVTAGAFTDPAPTLALPGFDEFMLGYKDRSIQLAPGDMSKVVPGGNGVFRATICRDGRAVGTWQRTVGPSSVRISVEPFTPLGSRASAEAQQAFATYGAFLGRTVTLIWP